MFVGAAHVVRPRLRCLLSRPCARTELCFLIHIVCRRLSYCFLLSSSRYCWTVHSILGIIHFTFLLVLDAFHVFSCLIRKFRFPVSSHSDSLNHHRNHPLHPTQVLPYPHRNTNSKHCILVIHTIVSFSSISSPPPFPSNAPFKFPSSVECV